ncbi:MAG: radical SAM family heme chaperone HemW [Rickettsiales bacterium]|nr:radical SAM family heme chaperone HemW [Rickettsiales bacterium]
MISIYIHWPFCIKRCPYCNFNTYVLKSLDTQQWLESYIKELQYFRRVFQDKKIKSIFLGGGTPSLMPTKIIEKILNYIGSLAQIDNNTEITIEVNPTSAEKNKLKEFKNIGINRVSIGIQSFNDHDLKILGRTHSSTEAIQTIKLAQTIFDNYSFDLIYARPNQTLKNWQTELRKALKYIKHHISLYQLTIEENTPFYFQHKKGKLKTLNHAIEAQMFTTNLEILEAHNIYQYEISNYAIKGKESLHNMAYWNYDEYLGIGPGAHSRIVINNDIYAILIEKNPNLWLKKLKNNSSSIQEKEKLSKTQIAYEYILMNIRKTIGINTNDFYIKFKEDIFKYLDQKALNSLQKNGWIHYNKKYILATKIGRNFLDTITREIISDNVKC